MLSQFSFQYFSRSELRNNPDLIARISKSVRKEEQESDYPLPVPDIEFYQARYSLIPFPFDEQNYILIENENKIIGHGIMSTNTRLNSEMAFIFVYIIPEYRGHKISKLVINHLLKTIPVRVKTVFFPIRADEYAPNYDFRKSLINHVLSKVGPVTFKARRSTSDLTRFKKEEITSKAETLKNEAVRKGFSFEFVEGRPDFEKLAFSEADYIAFLESIDNDMPRENASFEDIKLTSEMFNYRFDILKPLKRKRWHYIAIHNQSNKPVGLTEIIFNHTNPIVIHQGDTGVFHKYRGNKLGLTLKYMMLAKILTSIATITAKNWTTFNAASNSYMIKINDDLGYKEDALWYQFELKKEKFIDLFDMLP